MLFFDSDGRHLSRCERVIDSTLAAMQAHPSSTNVQVCGAKLLQVLAFRDENKQQLATERASKALAEALKEALGNDSLDIFPNRRGGLVLVDRVPVARIDAPAPDKFNLRWNDAEATRLKLQRDQIQQRFDDKVGAAFRPLIEWTI